MQADGKGLNMDRIVSWVTWACLFFFIGAATSNCATVAVKRDLTDRDGRKIGSVEVEHSAATTEGARELIGSVGSLQGADLADRADERATSLADKSIEKGQPTTVTTSGGQVTSGYVGYGYGQFGYGQFGGFAQMFPGASQEMMWVEAAGRQNYMLPSLGEPVVQAMPQTVGSPAVMTACPNDRYPANQAEQVACIRKDLDKVLRVHRP